jgi:hypothetical protein
LAEPRWEAQDLLPMLERGQAQILRTLATVSRNTIELREDYEHIRTRRDFDDDEIRAKSEAIGQLARSQLNGQKLLALQHRQVCMLLDKTRRFFDG